MNPILIEIWNIKIYWYSIFIFLAIIIGCSIIKKEAKKFDIPEAFLTNLFFWTLILAFIGARLYYVIFNFSQYSNDLLGILRVWEGGLAIHGGIIFGLLFVIFYTKRYKISTLFSLDMIVVGVIIGQSIGRWGNFFNGEAHGMLTTLERLRQLYTPDFVIKGMLIEGNYYYPTFLYESIWCFLGFILLLIVRRLKYTKIGQVFSLYMVWYGIGRFFIEMLRTDSLMLGDFKVAQIISLLMIIIGIILTIIFGKGSKFENKYNDINNVEKINF